MFKFDKEKEAVVVTGGLGFLGRHVCEEFKSRGYKHVTPTTRQWFHMNEENKKDWMKAESLRVDLLETKGASRAIKPSWHNRNTPVKGVIHLAAVVGGIGANQQYPGSFMHENLLMGINLIDAVRKNASMQNGGKFVQIGTVCAYPKLTPVPFKESMLWDGYPEETNAPYGIAKKALMELVKAYNNQYKDKFNGISLIPVNLYGPGDNFKDESSHVIPALIKKVYHAKAWNLEHVDVWGTGQASREFLYVKDAARGIVDAFEKYEGDNPINLGSGNEIKIADLVKLIVEIVGYEGKIKFDPTKPDGQPRRCLDVSKAKEEFGFEATTDFRKGLEETYEWYKTVGRGK